MPTPHVGDIKSELIVELEFNITNRAAGYPKLRLKKPDGSYLQRSGSDQLTITEVTDEVNGVVKLVFNAGEMDGAGAWLVEAKLSLAGGEFYTSDAATFSVAGNLT